MTLRTDLSIYNKFNFEKPPVAVKFTLPKPKGLEPLDKELPFCEMIKETQQRTKPFYFTKANENCVGKVVLGMEEMPPHIEGGLIGPKFGIYQEARVNNKIYQYIPKLQKNMVNYVSFSRLETLNFEPDLLILTAKPRQAEIVLRAMSYSTGEVWAPRTTPVLGCAWIYVYPYQSGNVNYTMTGLGFGMIAKKIFEEGWMLLSIPYNWIPTITQNLKEMEWVLPSYTDGREGFLKREKQVFDEAAREAQES